ncbi:hypothetical protein P8C59_003063 [Phyllachora maydis]|uniref:Ubiquitin-like 1-activating enzyme E1A n=1 Tax=Phyllachora maydis TaxID=1825666 RepID=A0AAD9I108_9PEZI|nr:hypothetical protein P8C59_003063 [Phyllachora maydis]
MATTLSEQEAQQRNQHIGPASNGISADEIALYDRQIRLWGFKAQERIRRANILLITMKALANEVAKNLVLAGIGSLTVVDHEPVTEADLGAQFFVEQQHVGRNRAQAASAALQKLNPRVRVLVDTGDIRAKGPSFFAAFDLVIATDVDPLALEVINTTTRLHNRPFYAAASHGIYGFLFADLIEHVFVLERARSNVPTRLGLEDRSRTRAVLAAGPKPGLPAVEQITKREVYSTWYLAADAAALSAEVRAVARRRKVVTPLLACFRALWDFQTVHGRVPVYGNPADQAAFVQLATAKHAALGLPPETLTPEALRRFLQNTAAEAAPVAAVLGGQLAQDVIAVLGANQQPIQNFVFFDGESMEANVYALHPEGDLGVKQLAASTSVSNGDPTAMRNAEAEILGAAAAQMPLGAPQQNVIALD